MILQFWRNPEFVRHARAELRTPRAITAALLTLVVCALVGLLSWSSEHDKLDAFFRLYHGWLVGIQFTVLGFWCASGCGQAIARERELKTYDFLKTTRLTAAEIMIGKITGVPVMAYFVLACSLPISVAAGALGGYGPRVLILIYVLLLMAALFVSLAGMVLSMFLEKSGTAAVSILVLFPMGWLFALVNTPFSGMSALSVLPAVFALYDPKDPSISHSPTLFGIPTSYVLLTPLLLVVCGAWLVLMLVRNLKLEREQIRLLSRWQAVGFGAFLNVLFYAFLDPRKLASQEDYNILMPYNAASLAMGLNGFLLLLIGLATLTSHERLKVWWRKRQAGEEGYFSESGLPWPWLIAVASAAYLMLVAEAAGMRGVIPLDQWHLKTAALQLGVLLVFALRDVLFLQYCNVTSMKRPLVKGVLYLGLYYFAVSIIAAVAGVSSETGSLFIFQVTTPFAVFAGEASAQKLSLGLGLGMGLQLAFIVILLRAITGRITRPASAGAAPPG